MADNAPIFENVPVELNLGQPEQRIGWASAFRDQETNKVNLSIIFDEQAGVLTDQLVEAFEIKAVGFAGVKRRPA